ncbi:DUF4906 domain-containing protein [Bacteroides sp.]|uniref:DUF4906 domain-containing protein n=1 Tax=Bacteroides sp. TaxID=29523 RepID=UPI00261D4761|nr:DUF4906 domain-containing protein [Bacteroides sp.]
MKHIYRIGLMKGLFAIVLLAGTASCVDYLDAPAPVIPDGKEVQVELSFGFADEEDGYDLSETTRVSGTAVVEAQSDAFVVTPTPKVRTRSGETTTEITQPDALYELHVIQYTQAGGLIGSVKYTAGATTIGEKLTFTLTQADNCQLVIFARGQGNTKPSVSGNLSNFQSLIMPSEVFKNIPTSGATQSQMNKMPYILHLPHVNVTSDGKLQSLTGAHDARLLLKRLAVKLTVNWKMSDALTTDHYGLKEVKLCQVPVDFRILPTTESTEWGTTYPSAVSEFGDTYRITDATELATLKQTVWIPANVRGSSAKATSPYYRTKENAPDAASYVELVVDNSVKQERLYYRAYLGGKETTDFNLKENTDYDWTLTVNSANYRTDGRIQLLDQTPVVSTNLVPTSNCLMMKPGTNICFNPYKHTSGTGGWNDELVSGGVILQNKAISSVKVLWQTKDAGTSGDLVMGYVIDDNHHENLVNVSDIEDKDNALVHVKVPITKGGNAVIESKNSLGETVWSWHIWISDYVPVVMNVSNITNDATRSMAIAAAQNATQGGMVQVYGGVSWTSSDGAFYKSVIMDRNLGATKAGLQANLIDRVSTFGLLYQGGRKDPFFSTADGTTNEVKTIYDGYGKTTEIGKISRSSVPYQTLIQFPLNFYYPGGGGILNSDKSSAWNGRNKTIYDPCPDGWKVPLNEYKTNSAKYSLCAGFGSTNASTVYEDAYGNNDNIMYWNGENLTSMKSNGGISANGVDVPGAGFLYFGGSGESAGSYSNKSAFFPGVSLRETTSGKYRSSVSNNSVFLWASTLSKTANHYIYQIQTGKLSFQHPVEDGYGFSVRCVQE